MFDKTKYLQEGKKIEQLFQNAIIDLGTAIIPTKEQDMFEHWDLGIEVKFDVKGLRKVSRSDNEFNENFHWIEIKNVNGNLGWLYGKADYIVFETQDYWMIVNRKLLVDFIQTKCAEKIWTLSPAPYKLYTRKERKDVITLVKTIDLSYLAEKILLKR